MPVTRKLYHPLLTPVEAVDQYDPVHPGIVHDIRCYVYGPPRYQVLLVGFVEFRRVIVPHIARTDVREVHVPPIVHGLEAIAHRSGGIQGYIQIDAEQSFTAVYHCLAAGQTGEIVMQPDGPDTGIVGHLHPETGPLAGGHLPVYPEVHERRRDPVGHRDPPGLRRYRIAGCIDYGDLVSEFPCHVPGKKDGSREESPALREEQNLPQGEELRVHRYVTYPYVVPRIHPEMELGTGPPHLVGHVIDHVRRVVVKNRDRELIAVSDIAGQVPDHVMIDHLALRRCIHHYRTRPYGLTKQGNDETLTAVGIDHAHVGDAYVVVGHDTECELVTRVTLIIGPVLQEPGQIIVQNIYLLNGRDQIVPACVRRYHPVAYRSSEGFRYHQCQGVYPVPAVLDSLIGPRTGRGPVFYVDDVQSHIIPELHMDRHVLAGGRRPGGQVPYELR